MNIRLLSTALGAMQRRKFLGFLASIPVAVFASLKGVSPGEPIEIESSDEFITVEGERLIVSGEERLARAYFKTPAHLRRGDTLSVHYRVKA